MYMVKKLRFSQKNVYLIDLNELNMEEIRIILKYHFTTNIGLPPWQDNLDFVCNLFSLEERSLFTIVVSSSSSYKSQ